MKFKLLAMAALAASSFGAQAALATYAPWAAHWPQPGGEGVGIDNVLFNVQSARGATVAMGAHAYKNSEFLPNNGTDTYYAQSGTYPGEPNRANWSFDFAWDFGTGCSTSCVVSLFVDVDASAGESLVRLFAIQNQAVTFQGTTFPAPTTGFGSYNMEMSFGSGNFLLLPGNNLLNTYNFNPFSASSTAFRLVVSDSAGEVVSSNITVNVPEPATLSLVGLALLGASATRRRRG